MPRSIPKGLTAEHILLALADLDAGIGHPFGAPTGYELVHEGLHYPPKAVIGLAFRHLTGSVLPPEDFSGGEAPGQANYVLRGLGFSVEQKGEPEEADSKPADWSEDEVRLIVADYFDMMRMDLAEEPFSKAEHNRSLRESLNGRSKGSVEFKHQNISAVLLDREIPYLDGYKPAKNYQKRVLPEAVEDYLAAHPEIYKLIESSPVLNPTLAPRVVEGDALGYFDDPPDRMSVPVGDSKPWLSRKGRKIDYARRDALNRQLGRLGEQFALELERQRLLAAGRSDLASRVEWVSETCGDGIGFDILSFSDADDCERYLEVKTTGMGKYFPFIVTGNELRCSEDMTDSFELYRVFDFSRRPRVYVLPRALSKSCSLEPVTYRARLVGE
jgi:Domain of unknown function (DUF3883)